MCAWLKSSLRPDHQAVSHHRGCVEFHPPKFHFHEGPLFAFHKCSIWSPRIRTRNYVHPEGHLFLIHPKILYRLMLASRVLFSTIAPRYSSSTSFSCPSCSSQANESKIQNFSRNKRDIFRGLNPVGRQM